MRTEDDLRQALGAEPDHDTLQRLAAYIDGIGVDGDAASTHSMRRPRFLVPLAAAASVVLVAGGAVALAGLQRGHGDQAGSGRSAHDRRPTWNLRVAKVPGYTATRVQATSLRLSNGSTTMIESTDRQRPEQGIITTCPLTFRACADPSQTSREQSVRIHGRPGSFHAGRPVMQSSRSHYPVLHPWKAALRDQATQPGLTWNSGHHTTVFLSGTFGFDPTSRTYDNAAAKKILLRIANAVSTGHHDAARLPFELRDLPGRVAAEGVNIEAGGACGDYGTGPRSRSDPLGEVFTACRVRTGSTRAATVAAADRADAQGYHNGPTRLESEQPVVHDFADGTSLVIAVDRPSVVSRGRARSLAAHADVSPRLGVPATWLVVD